MEIIRVPNLLKVPDTSSADDRRQAPKRHPRRTKEKIENGVVYAPDGRVDGEPAVSHPHIDVTA